MAATLTKKQAADAVAAARDEREIIQANLLDLDGSFGRRLLAGATLRLFDAYKAKAARLGATEDPSLAARYDQARQLLWTAPCDLTAAADAVNRFQRAVLAVGAQRL